MSRTDLLVVTGLTKRFGGLTALDGVSLRVAPGEAVGIIGPNGAGKSTLVDCLSGVTAADAGTVLLDGRRIDGAPVWRRSRQGIGRTFQRLELFEGMTVADHLLVAEQAQTGTVRIWRDLLHRGGPTPDELERVRAVLAQLGLADVAERPVATLDLGRARLVELGRALMGAPRLLLLDEPSSGLDVGDTTRLAGVLDDVRRRSGAAVVLIEHDLAVVEAVADRLVVLDLGRVLADGPVATVLADPAVRRAYLGTSA